MQLKASITAWVFLVLSWGIAASSYGGIVVDSYEQVSSKRVVTYVSGQSPTRCNSVLFCRNICALLMEDFKSNRFINFNNHIRYQLKVA